MGSTFINKRISITRKCHVFQISSRTKVGHITPNLQLSNALPLALMTNTRIYNGNLSCLLCCIYMANESRLPKYMYSQLHSIGKFEFVSYSSILSELEKFKQSEIIVACSSLRANKSEIRFTNFLHDFSQFQGQGFVMSAMISVFLLDVYNIIYMQLAWHILNSFHL